MYLIYQQKFSFVFFFLNQKTTKVEYVKKLCIYFITVILFQFRFCCDVHKRLGLTRVFYFSFLNVYLRDNVVSYIAEVTVIVPLSTFKFSSLCSIHFSLLIKGILIVHRTPSYIDHIVHSHNLQCRCCSQAERNRE